MARDAKSFRKAIIQYIIHSFVHVLTTPIVFNPYFRWSWFFIRFNGICHPIRWQVVQHGEQSQMFLHGDVIPNCVGLRAGTHRFNGILRLCVHVEAVDMNVTAVWGDLFNWTNIPNKRPFYYSTVTRVRQINIFEEWITSPVIMDNVVVFPAPFGPNWKREDADTIDNTVLRKDG